MRAVTCGRHGRTLAILLLAVAAMLGGLAVAAAQDAASVERKIKQFQEQMPKWVEAGGDPQSIAPLARQLEEALKAGRPEVADGIVEKMLAIVRSGPAPKAVSTSQVRLKVYDATGRPLPRRALSPRREDVFMAGVFPLDVDYNPIAGGVASVEDGVVTLSTTVSPPFALHFDGRVPGFGRMKVYADNGGKGYSITKGEIDLPLEAVRSRIAKIDAVLARNPKGVFRSETVRRYESAKARLASVEGGAGVDRAEVYRALADALWAGEMVTLDEARAAIAKRGRRSGFLFGASTVGSERWGAREKDLFSAVFNLATLSTFYLRSYEDVRGRPQHGGSEQLLAWTTKAGIEAKGHPLVYVFDPNIPPWLSGKGYDEMREAMRLRVAREVARFKGRVKIWDGINEPHIHTHGYSLSQMVELTRTACSETKRADPAALCVVNATWPTGDYVIDPELRARGAVQTPWQYFRSLQQAGVDYDVIGIQVYDPGLDMMELSRLIDRFARLGKPIHVTESESASSAADDRRRVFKMKIAHEWHRSADEDLQADWIEQFYTIMYAKPGVQAISWWDLADNENSGWPWGGLLRYDFTPKKSYGRLKQLLETWGFARKAGR